MYNQCIKGLDSDVVILETQVASLQSECYKLKALLLTVCNTMPTNRSIEAYGGKELVEWYKKNK